MGYCGFALRPVFPGGYLAAGQQNDPGKGAGAGKWKGLKWFGWTLIALAALYIIMGLSGELTVEPGESLAGGLILMTALLGGGGAFMVWKGTVYMARGAMYARYAAIAHAAVGRIDPSHCRGLSCAV